MTNNVETGPVRLASLTNFVNMLLRRECHREVIPILFGASLIALEKKLSGIRPIAIGYTLHRIAAKCANNFVLLSLGNKLLPTQLGLGSSGDCEAAVHATRRFINDMPADFVIAKLDFSNAFNNLRRDTMLNAIVEHMPEIYCFCHLAYDMSSALKFFNHIMSSQGVQQGDPLGPLLFCLSIHPLLLACQSQLKIAYMDDITLVGLAAVVAADVALVKVQGKPLGLVLIEKKYETITTDGHADEISLQQFIRHTPLSSTLLRAPLLRELIMYERLSRETMQ